MFILNGFQRNNILYPNIINLEFMFNDEESAEFSMHNYFGLYLTENKVVTYNEVIKDHDQNLDLTYYNENN